MWFLSEMEWIQHGWIPFLRFYGGFFAYYGVRNKTFSDSDFVVCSTRKAINYVVCLTLFLRCNRLGGISMPVSLNLAEQKQLQLYVFYWGNELAKNCLIPFNGFWKFCDASIKDLLDCFGWSHLTLVSNI